MNLTAQANQATLAEAAEIVGIGVETLRSAVERGALEAKRSPFPCRYGFQYIVDLEDIEAWKVARKRPLESLDAHELARIRNIKLRSAQRLIQRRAKHGSEK